MLLKRQANLLDKFVLSLPFHITHVDYDNLPSDLRGALERIKNQETLWCDAERYISDKLNGKRIQRVA